ncbi:MAG TPA: serine hydrolase domain-containing protein [Gemmatimonadaceae bacterium]|nr:serine hydrolase domain-containing protein [Gemmatimonadaceae bacterium]
MRLSFFSVLAAPLIFVSPPDVPATVALSTGVRPRSAAADTIGDKLRRQLTPWLEDRARRGEFSGTVVVAKDGTPVYTAAFGMADRERKVPNTTTTRYNLGSMNKMWTAVAIAQLVEQGKVDLDATVGKYVPDLPNQSIRETVKVRHLLSHTSGTATYFRKGFLRDKKYAASAADYVPYYADEPLSFTPGARMQYSNAGFALLGLIVERVSGQSFYDYAKRNVVDRAGMKTAAYLDVRSHPTDVAVGYARPQNGGGAGEIPNWDLIEQHSSPAGGAFASAADLLAFSRALWSNKLVGAPLVKQLTTGQVAMGPDMQYALGFGVGTTNGWRHIGHNGGIPGANAEFVMFPDQGVDVVVLANIDGPAATDVLRRITTLLTGAASGPAADGGPQLVTVDVGPDGKERRSGTVVTGGPPPSGPPATLPAGMASDRLPDNIQGRRAGAFLEAFSAGTGPALATFLEKNAVPRTDRTIEERVKGLEGIYDRIGKLTFKRLIGVRDDQIRVGVESEKDGPLMVIIQFEANAPNRVTLFNFEAGNRER